MTRQIDPLGQAEQAIERARAALDMAQEAIDLARLAATRPTSKRAPAGRNAAHKIAETIAAEYAAGLPLDDPICRRIYIAAYETYNQTIASGRRPQDARTAAHSAAEETIRP